MQNFTQHLTSKQTEPLMGREKEQVKNNAGGFVFQVTPEESLRRFLILGTEGGSYYATERDLTKENVTSTIELIQKSGARAVEIIKEISVAGRAPKQDPALFALALVFKHGSPEVKQLAEKAFPEIVRIGTHLLHFVKYAESYKAFGRIARRAVANWYLKKEPKDLEYQLLKYQNRDGFTQRDVLNLVHPKPKEKDDAHAQLLKFVVTQGGYHHVQNPVTGKWEVSKEQVLPSAEIFARVHAVERAKTAKGKALVDLIVTHRLSREMIPTEALQEPAVWEALLQDMPIEAMVRNLGKLSSPGIDLLKPLSATEALVKARLGDLEKIKKSRIHPIKILTALLTYRNGRGEKGSLTWTPSQTVLTALDDAFYLAFSAVEPTGKRRLSACDVSGSMWGGSLMGVSGFSPGMATGVLAMVTAKTEARHYAMAFSSGFQELKGFSAKKSLPDVCKLMQGLTFERTDCAVPMIWALQNKIEVDSFEIYTDSETWHGSVHPCEALRKYRDKTGIPAKMAVYGLLGNKFTIADPADAGTMDVVGFDSAAPAIVSDFVRG